MAEGGKPLAEASVRLSVEGAEKVRESIQQTANDARDAARAYRELHVQQLKAADAAELDAQRLAGVNLETQRLTSGIEELAAAEAAATGVSIAHGDALDKAAASATSATDGMFAFRRELGRWLGIVGLATGAVTAFYAGVRKLGDYVRSSTHEAGLARAANLYRDMGIDAAVAAKDVEVLRKAMDTITDQQAKIRKNFTWFGPNAGQRAEIRQLTEYYYKIDQLRLDAATRVSEAESKRVLAEEESLRKKQASALLDAERLATLTEEEKFLKRLEAIDKARLELPSVLPGEWDKIKRRIMDEYDERKRLEREVLEAKKKADEEAIKERERKEREASQERIRKATEEAQKRAEAIAKAERDALDRLRSKESQDMKSIAVDIQSIPNLLRVLVAKESGRTWR